MIILKRLFNVRFYFIFSSDTNEIFACFLEFTKYRGECIVCMNYYYYSHYASLGGYIKLKGNFDQISDVLVQKLQQFVDQNFDPSQGYLWSMSFGSQLAINAGRDFGGQMGNLDGR